MSQKIVSRNHSAKFLRYESASSDAVKLSFRVEFPFPYKPGQYVWVQMPHLKYPDPKGDRRAFSILNPFDNSGEIQILFRSSSSGFKRSILELNSGEEIFLIGPFGSSFFLPSDNRTPLVLVAGGVGVAPFINLVQSAVTFGYGASIDLICADQSTDRMPLHQTLLDSIKNYPAIHYSFFSHILQSEDIENIPFSAEHLYYISGTQGFVDHVHGLLCRRGVFEHQFRFENFYPTNPETILMRSLFGPDGFPQISQKEPAYVAQRRSILLAAIQSSSHHIIITDTNGLIVFANKAAQRITGYALEEMIGQTPRLWGGMMPKSFYERLWKSKLEGHTIDEEIINRRKDGSLYEVMAHIAPIRDESGHTIGFIGTEEDISHIRASENMAKTSEERFLQLASNIPEVYWVTQLIPEEKILYISPAFETIWGVSRDDLYNDSRIWIQSIHPEDKEKVLGVFRDFITQKGEYKIQYRIVRPNGSIVWISDWRELVLDDRGFAYRAVGVARDITQDKAVDQAKSEFVSLASHQLKTPIGALNWDAEMLLDGDYGPLQEKQKEVIQEMYATNQRMKDLVNGLLNISRIDMGTFVIDTHPVDVVAICNDVLQELRSRIAKKRHTIVTHYAENLPPFSADPNLLRIIFQNFISNAIKYTPDGGRISIHIEIRMGEFLISVANNGEPIPIDDQPRLFEKLFRASNAQKQDPDGNGLGLYLVKAIAEHGGGRVWFESAAGRDTIFSIAFPVSGMKSKVGTKVIT